jgi:hypothetical protein
MILADLIEKAALMQSVQQAEAHALVVAGAFDDIAQAEDLAGLLENFQDPGGVDQRFDRVPAVVGSLHVDS